jgi:hypothetical protein
VVLLVEAQWRFSVAQIPLALVGKAQHTILWRTQLGKLEVLVGFMGKIQMNRIRILVGLIGKSLAVHIRAGQLKEEETLVGIMVEIVERRSRTQVGFMQII